MPCKETQSLHRPIRIQKFTIVRTAIRDAIRAQMSFLLSQSHHHKKKPSTLLIAAKAFLYFVI